MTALELIDIICPEHSRTSCSDENISNGFYTDEGIITKEYFPRCSRCALLEIVNKTSIDEDKLIDSISIHFKY